MPELIFTQQLKRFADAPTIHTDAATLRLALEAAVEGNERLRAYILDEQGRLRPHVAVFIDGARLKSRTQLDVALGPDSAVHVLQALSGG